MGRESRTEPWRTLTFKVKSEETFILLREGGSITEVKGENISTKRERLIASNAAES